MATAVIPDFASFTTDLRDIFDKTRPLDEGAVATYIPQLARVPARHWGAAVCTVDGERWGAGDVDVELTVQSCMKPINYCIALEECGEEVVHQVVGRSRAVEASTSSPSTRRTARTTR